MDRRRYLRQILLPEIGEAGQAKICAATAEVRGAGEVAELYAIRAGFQGISMGVAAEVPPGLVEIPGARAVLAGALTALRAMHEALS